MELYPLFLYYFSTVDPRQHETSYKRTLVIAITDLKAKRQKLAALFSEGFNFSDLDKLKQKGFYSTETDGVCKSNKESVDPLVSKAVLDFAWRITDTLKFVLGNHFENYRELFRKLRDNMDEATLNVIRKEATKIVTNIFGLEKEQS
jgi:lactate dehydrogenase-like 2-hydroxyacid dehydrogenase